MNEICLKQQKAKNSVIFYLPLVLLSIVSMPLQAQDKTAADSAVKSAEEFEKYPRAMVPARPFLFLNMEEIKAARALAEREEWAKKLKENYIRIAEEWLKRDYEFIRKIIPPKGSIYTYGLGLNLDPLEQKKMIWRGWKDPRHVEASNGIIYPDELHKDEGYGWTDPKSKTNYYFIALANGMTIKQLETVDLPALVNAYLLTTVEAYAERALWILDAIATIYPRANEGPVDYPGLAPGKADGGRLDRPYYQTARAMMNYAYFAEMLSLSRYAGRPSLSNPGFTVMKNIELNLLMNGADYCLHMARAGKGASYELNNGNIDYNRATLAVGALLGITEWIDWALNGPLGFRYAISNSIDINGRYFETGASYALHTRDLLLSTAHFLKRMRIPEFPHGYEAYDDPKFAQFALGFFTGIQVAGRLPLFGDSSSDTAIKDDGLIFDRGTLVAAQQFYRYSDKKEIRDAALQAASLMLHNLTDKFAYDAGDLFNAYGQEEFIQKAKVSENLNSCKGSKLLFDYGTLILSSGEKGSERAALMRFGPSLNHSQADELGLAFYAYGREFSFDPGYFNTHLRFGFTTTTVAHNLLVVNRTNQLRRPAPGGDLQTWTDGEVLRSAAVNNPKAYAHLNLSEYKRRVALIDISQDESYIIDNFWACGGNEYDYSLHGISNGELTILPGSGTELKKTGKGSVLDENIDYSSEMDLNGRIKSYLDKPFYFAPPGGGYGFLGKPVYYNMNGPAFMKWSATDNTGHQMYVWQFAPPSSELITAMSPKPKPPIDLTYTLAHAKVPASETVHFTSIILSTKGENRISEVRQLFPLTGPGSVYALRLSGYTAENKRGMTHFYIASDSVTATRSFEDDLSFSGEEGFLELDDAGKVMSASLTGAGFIKKGKFKFTVSPLFNKALEILEIKEQPLRVLVNASYADTKQLEGSALRVTRPMLARPYVLRVIKSEAEGRNSWLTLDASSDVHAAGQVKSFDTHTNSITTDAPFPHTRPYVYTYDEKSGLSSQKEEGVVYDYNGGYNGFRIVDSKDRRKKADIKSLENKRTQIVLTNSRKTFFNAGDQFEIRLLSPGDSFDIPVWGQAVRDGKNNWRIKGTGKASVIE